MFHEFQPCDIISFQHLIATPWLGRSPGFPVHEKSIESRERFLTREKPLQAGQRALPALGVMDAVLDRGGHFSRIHITSRGFTWLLSGVFVGAVGQMFLDQRAEAGGERSFSGRSNLERLAPKTRPISVVDLLSLFQRLMDQTDGILMRLVWISISVFRRISDPDRLRGSSDRPVSVRGFDSGRTTTGGWDLLRGRSTTGESGVGGSWKLPTFQRVEWRMRAVFFCGEMWRRVRNS